MDKKYGGMSHLGTCKAWQEVQSAKEKFGEVDNDGS
jgi:hypothetical protein